MDIYQVAFENAPDPILFVDAGGRILRVNGLGGKAFGYSPDELIGRLIEELVPRRYAEAHRLNRAEFSEHTNTRSMGTGKELMALRKDGSEFPVDVMLSTAEMPEGRIVIAIVRDITERKRAEALARELARTNQERLGEIKILQGLLPICAHCKNIRDDQGFWQKVEVYFHGHAEVDFSHGICPACMAELYPGFMNGTGAS